MSARGPASRLDCGSREWGGHGRKPAPARLGWGCGWEPLRVPASRTRPQQFWWMPSGSRGLLAANSPSGPGSVLHPPQPGSVRPAVIAALRVLAASVLICTFPSAAG